MISISRLILCVALLTSMAAAQATPTPTPASLCSAGSRNGERCDAGFICPGGACVLARGVCSGGKEDGFSCPCPEGTCSASPACADDPLSGTCTGGARAGQCCSLTFGCRDGATCASTQKVCAGGKFKGASCLEDRHCPAATCVANGLVCTAGIKAGQACADPLDCPAAACLDPNTACEGDCDRGGDVTVDELVATISIALGGAPVSECGAADTSGDQQITVDEILSAVNRALNGCPASGNLTPTPTP